MANPVGRGVRRRRGANLKAVKRLFGESWGHDRRLPPVSPRARSTTISKPKRLLEAVFDQVSQGATRGSRPRRTVGEGRTSAMAKGTKPYFAACVKDTTRQIVLHDCPAVLGWERRKQPPFRAAASLERTMDDRPIARQPIEPLSRLLLGAVTEAAIACSGRDLHSAGGGRCARVPNAARCAGEKIEARQRPRCKARCCPTFRPGVRAHPPVALPADSLVLTEALASGASPAASADSTSSRQSRVQFPTAVVELSL